MNRKTFVKKTISTLKPARFKRLKDILDSARYIPFDFVEHEKIDENVFEEKVSDFFEKVELLAGGKNFNYIIDQYVSVLDSLVKDYIDGASRSIIGGTSTESRAKKYYDEANALKKAGLYSFDDLLDYSRLMLCLYMAVINNKHKTVSNFEYSSECLVGTDIMESLRNEKISTILGEKNRFDTKGAYSIDRCTFIMVIIMYQYIKSNEVEVED